MLNHFYFKSNTCQHWLTAQVWLVPLTLATTRLLPILFGCQVFGRQFESTAKPPLVNVFLSNSCWCDLLSQLSKCNMVHVHFAFHAIWLEKTDSNYISTRQDPNHRSSIIHPQIIYIQESILCPIPSDARNNFRPIKFQLFSQQFMFITVPEPEQNQSKNRHQ